MSEAVLDAVTPAAQTTMMGVFFPFQALQNHFPYFFGSYIFCSSNMSLLKITTISDIKKIAFSLLTRNVACCGESVLTTDIAVPIQL